MPLQHINDLQQHPVMLFAFRCVVAFNQDCAGDMAFIQPAATKHDPGANVGLVVIGNADLRQARSQQIGDFGGDAHLMAFLTSRTARRVISVSSSTVTSGTMSLITPRKTWSTEGP